MVLPSLHLLWPLPNKINIFKMVLFFCSSESLSSFMKNVTGYINDKTLRNYISNDRAGLTLYQRKSQCIQPKLQFFFNLQNAPVCYVLYKCLIDFFIGLDRNEFVTIYRTLLNMQKHQSKALIVLFYKVRHISTHGVNFL